MSAPNPPPKYIYKVYPHSTVDSQFAFPVPVPASHVFVPTASDAQAGYVHLGTKEVIPSALSRFYSDLTGVVLVRIGYERISSFKVVKWEAGPDGRIYPHLYGDLEGENIDSVRDVFQENGSYDNALAKLEKEGWFI